MAKMTSTMRMVLKELIQHRNPTNGYRVYKCLQHRQKKCDRYDLPVDLFRCSIGSVYTAIRSLAELNLVRHEVKHDQDGRSYDEIQITQCGKKLIKTEEKVQAMLILEPAFE